MKASAIARFRHKLALDEALYGLTVTTPAAAITDIAAAMGLDWILLDDDRVGPEDIAEHARATRRSTTAVLIRQPELSRDSLERSISLGADGFLINLPAFAERTRGMDDHTAFALKNSKDGEPRPLLGIFLQENDGDESLASVLDRSEIDVIFLDRPTLPAAERRLKLIRSMGRRAGISVDNERALHSEHKRGFQLLGVGTDIAILSRELQGALAVARNSAEERPRNGLPSETGEK